MSVFAFQVTNVLALVYNMKFLIEGECELNYQKREHMREKMELKKDLISLHIKTILTEKRSKVCLTCLSMSQ